MRLGLINSAWFGSGLDTLEGLRRTKHIGFDTVDIFADPAELDITERRRIKKVCSQIDLPIVSVVCCALGIADPSNQVRRFHIERAKRHLDLAYELEASNLLLVIGEYVWQKEIITPREQWTWAVEGAHELGQHASHLGLEIAIELEPFHLSIIDNIDRMSEFLKDVDTKAVKANLDISHLTLSHTPAEDILKLQNRIAHVHISDCNGKQHGDLPPGRGVVDFPKYLQKLKESGFDGTISVELEFAPDPAEITEWVTEAYRETAKLMDGLGLSRLTEHQPVA